MDCLQRVMRPPQSLTSKESHLQIVIIAKASREHLDCRCLPLDDETCFVGRMVLTVPLN